MTTSAFSQLDVRHQGPITRVFLNRPEVRNAFNGGVVAKLTALFAELPSRPGLCAIVIGAHDSAFCAGADLAWMRDMATRSPGNNHADAQALACMLWTLDRCPVPIVGPLQGDCYAGGMVLAAVCEVVVAAEGVCFCLSEMRLGWVHEVCAAEALDGEVDAIVANGPDASRACKRLVRDVAGQDLTEALRDETARRMAEMRTGPEAHERLKTFLDKRPPAWTLESVDATLSQPDPSTGQAAKADTNPPSIPSGRTA